VGDGVLEHHLQVGGAGHLHLVPGAILDEPVDVADAVARQPAAELEDHPVEAGVPRGAHRDQGRLGLRARRRGDGEDENGEDGGEDDGPDEPHGYPLHRSCCSQHPPVWSHGRYGAASAGTH
jgi:hypothetical protein